MLTWQPNNSPVTGTGVHGLVAPGKYSPGRAAGLAGMALAVATLWPLCAAIGTSLARLDLNHMAARAAAVARARCIAVDVREGVRGLETLSTFERTESWKGRVPARFVVLLPGGAAAGRRETVEGAPRFTKGEEVVLFLEPLRGGAWTIVGWVQGTYRIHRDPRNGAERAVRDSAGMPHFDPRERTFHSSENRLISVAQLRAVVAQVAYGGTQ